MKRSGKASLYEAATGAASLRNSWLAAAVLALSGVTASSSEARPQTRDEPPEHRQDFRFTTPRASVAFRLGWMFRTEGSDIYDFFRDFLTIDSGDFDSPQVDVDVALWLSTRSDLVVGFGYTAVELPSEARDFVDGRQPTQRTEHKEISVTASYKYYLSERGREVGQLAWVSSVAAPYVGGGGGIAHYRLVQQGGFIDVDSMEIFGATLESSGWAPLLHGFGGVDVRLARNLFATFEGRYQFGNGSLGEDFRDFERLDLSGLSATVGLLFVF